MKTSKIKKEIAESLIEKDAIERFYRFGDIPSQKYEFIMEYLAS